MLPAVGDVVAFITATGKREARIAALTDATAEIVLTAGVVETRTVPLGSLRWAPKGWEVVERRPNV